MPKIIKNGKEYSGVPIEVVTAWAPTADPVQVKEPLMGNTDISSIGDGTVTGAIDTIKSDLIVYRDYTDTTGTSQYQGYYFVDISYTLAGYTLISATNLGSTSNRPSFVQVVTASNIRAYCPVQETAVTVRCVYIKNQ